MGRIFAQSWPSGQQRTVLAPARDTQDVPLGQQNEGGRVEGQDSRPLPSAAQLESSSLAVRSDDSVSMPMKVPGALLDEVSELVETSTSLPINVPGAARSERSSAAEICVPIKVPGGGEPAGRAAEMRARRTMARRMLVMLGIFFFFSFLPLQLFFFPLLVISWYFYWIVLAQRPVECCWFVSFFR